ncbi:hypothetical protein BJ684DRAFT_20389, partial [Piptocephalis cylindrospora]
AKQLWTFTGHLLLGNVRPTVTGFSLLLEAAITTEAMLFLLPQITLLVTAILAPVPALAVYSALIITTLIASISPIVAKTVKYVIDGDIDVMVRGFSELYEMRNVRWSIGSDGLFHPVGPGASPPRTNPIIYHPSH